MDAMPVRHASLYDVIGKRAIFRGITIVPARIDLDGNSFEPSFPLADLPRDKMAAVLRGPVDRGYDISWVRARFPHAFGISPEQSNEEKGMLRVGFIAVFEGGEEGIAFECCDYYGRTSLIFSEAETDETSKVKIAESFWGILLAEPDALSDFEAQVFHPGAGVDLNYGCADGRPFFFESDDCE